MLRRSLFFITIDLVFLFLLFFLFSKLAPGFPLTYSNHYWQVFIFSSLSWISWSYVFKKYTFSSSESKEKVIFRLIKINASFIFLSYVYLIFFPLGIMRSFFALYLFFITFTEGVLSYLYLLDKSLNKDMEDLAVFSTYTQTRRDRVYPVYDVAIQKGKLYKNIKELIIEEGGRAVFNYIKEHIPLTEKSTIIVSTTTKFNIRNTPLASYQCVVNLKNINDAQYLNKFFEEVNAKLNQGGIYIGAVETYTLRKKRILNRFPPVLNWVYYTFDYLLKRVMPKLILTKKLYFYITEGRNRVISRSEILGRLYSCGFEVFDERFIGDRLFYKAIKVDKPKFDLHPTYGPLIKLRRYGKNGKIIGVYKMRTMHAYSEYLQSYIYANNDLEEGGKFKDDFRVTSIGKFMRKFWIDELPMLLNLLKGEMKIVGVRPLSAHYFDLYSKELKSKRLKYKPGLIPPFYVDMPKTLEEIMASEMRYLEAYEEHPLRTDIKYFFTALYNIFIKRARSK